MAYALVQSPGENAVSIMEQEAVCVICRNRFAKLLEGPLRRGMRRDTDVQQSAAAVFDNDKNVEETKGRCDHDAEVARHNRLRMIAYKGPPALGLHTVAWPPVRALWHVLAHSTWRDPQTELQQEFIGNTLLAPCGVLVGYTTDEGSELRRDWGASGTRFPTPEQVKHLSMPADKGFRLDYSEGLSPVEPVREPDQGDPSRVGSPCGFVVALLIQGKLFTQKEIFRRKDRSWA